MLLCEITKHTYSREDARKLADLSPSEITKQLSTLGSEEEQTDFSMALYHGRRMKELEERKQFPKPFDETTTDLHFYDNLLNNPEYAEQQDYYVKIEWMKPLQYIEACTSIFDSSYERLEQTRTDTGKINKYMELLKNGTTFPMLVLHYYNHRRGSQEGLHRAFAAKELGITKIPVMIVHE